LAALRRRHRIARGPPASGRGSPPHCPGCSGRRHRQDRATGSSRNRRLPHPSGPGPPRRCHG
jgi:hypothetical protein